MKYRIKQKYVMIEIKKNDARDIVNIPDDAICITIKQINHGFIVVWLEPYVE